MRRGTINDCSFLDKEGNMVVEQGPGIFLRGRLTGGWGMFTASDYLCLHVIESGNGREIKTEDPQEVADIIWEEVIRTSSGRIEDDMTIGVAQIKHNIPKWSSIPMGMRRKKAQ